MLKLEDQVCSLEWAKELKKAGVSQESLWSWYETTDRDDIPGLNRSKSHCPTCGHPSAPYYEEVSAFTVSELLDILPTHTSVYRVDEEVEDPSNWACVKHEPGNHSHWERVFWAEHPADACARMVLSFIPPSHSEES